MSAFTKPFESFHVVLVEPMYEGNVGGVARVMKNFGFTNLAMVKPCMLDKEARQKAMHGLDILKSAKHYGSFKEILGDFDFIIGTTAKTGEDGNALRTPVYPEGLYNALDRKGRIALVFGREDYGLLNEELAECDMLVTIPANPEYSTLNLTQSVGIILYELSKDDFKFKNKRKKFVKVDGDLKRVLFKYYDEAVDVIYDRTQERRLNKWTFRQLIGRSFVSARESKTMIGFHRKISEKLKGVKQ
ncbi:MAG: RNA methyltransferase [Candidatus Altiarchaeota archaeon]|nr:RNA methyltransferase [Candidatus Altiarchaeota archaeon]